MSLTGEKQNLVKRETDIGTTRSSNAAGQRCGVSLGAPHEVETVEYIRESLSGSKRTLSIDEEGTVVISGKEPMHEMYGSDEDSFNQRTTLYSLDLEMPENGPRDYHENSMYGELDEIIYRIEDEVFDNSSML